MSVLDQNPVLRLSPVTPLISQNNSEVSLKKDPRLVVTLPLFEMRLDDVAHLSRYQDDKLTSKGPACA